MRRKCRHVMFFERAVLTVRVNRIVSSRFTCTLLNPFRRHLLFFFYLFFVLSVGFLSSFSRKTVWSETSFPSVYYTCIRPNRSSQHPPLSSNHPFSPQSFSTYFTYSRDAVNIDDNKTLHINIIINIIVIVVPIIIIPRNRICKTRRRRGTQSRAGLATLAICRYYILIRSVISYSFRRILLVSVWLRLTTVYFYYNA